MREKMYLKPEYIKQMEEYDISNLDQAFREAVKEYLYWCKDGDAMEIKDARTIVNSEINCMQWDGLISLSKADELRSVFL